MFRRLLAVVVLCASCVAFAGAEEDDSELLAANAAARRWQAKGPSAIREVMRAACDDGEYLRAEAAKGVLASWGDVALKALLPAIAKGRAQDVACDDAWLDAVALMLCQTPAKKLPALLKRLNAGLARQQSEDADVALDAVDAALRLPRDSETECPNKDAILRGTAKAAVALIGVEVPSERRSSRLSVLEDYGELLAPVVPQMMALLDSAPYRVHALALLEAVGSAGAPAVPKVAALLRTEVGTPAAGALAGIGVPEAVAPMVELARASLANDCQKPRPFQEIATPLGKLGRLGDDVARQMGELLGQGLDRGAGQEVAILGGIALLEGRGAFLEPRLRRVVDDASATVSRRAQFLDVLERIKRTPRDARETAIDQAIHRKMDARRWAEPTPQVQEPEPDAEHRARVAVAAASHALALCREIAGRPRSDVQVAGDTAALESLYGCLLERLCGSDPATYERDVKACCDAAKVTCPH